MRVLFTGGREYTDNDAVRRAFDILTEEGMKSICEGGARGLDTLARGLAIRRGIWCVTYWAPWNGPLGKGAGPARNKAMLTHFKPDLVAAFPGGPGTADMKVLAASNGVPVREFS